MAERIAQKNTTQVTLGDTTVSTAGKRVAAYLVTAKGVATEIGHIDEGDVAGVDLTIPCTWPATPGSYTFEVVADADGEAPIHLVPNARTGWPVRVIIGDTKAIPDE